MCNHIPVVKIPVNKRQKLDLEKTHGIDAAVIAGQGKPLIFKYDVLYKRHVSKGDYQQTKGIRSQQRIPTGKIEGFRKFDKVRYKGAEYWIKGRMSTGYAILMDITGTTVNLKPIPKFNLMERLKARVACIM